MRRRSAGPELANSSANWSPVTLSASSTPPLRKARMMRLVAPCASVGPSARRCANFMPFAISSSLSVTTRLTTFHSASVLAGYSPPLITNSAARAGPARSAIRCVPPAPGVSPTTASTRPNWASSVAQSMSQPSETSSPAVRQSPCTSARVGMSSASSRLAAVSSEPKDRSAPPCSTTCWKPFTSAPPVKRSPSARQTSALASDFSTSSMQFTRACQASIPNKLSGGLSRTMWARLPSISRRTGALGHRQSFLSLSAIAAISSSGPPRGIQGSFSGSSS